MPKYIIPRKSGVHRAACFALYRALLRQRRELQLNEHQQHIFRQQIWTVFKRNEKLQSPPEIVTALRLGYETLEGLHDGTRQQRLLDRIFELASKPKSNAPLEEPLSSTQAQTVQADKAPKIQPAPYPGAARTLDRPYQNLSGRRHVPALVNANRVPILRIKKPQPPFLSRIIRNKVKTRNHRILSGARLTNELPVAQDEDEWDNILNEVAELDSKNPLEPHWRHEVKQAIDDNHRLQVGAIQKRADVSAEMHAIVEKEKALAQEEKLRIRHEKRKAYKVRRLARMGMGDSEIQKPLDSSIEETVVPDAPAMMQDVLNQDQQELRPPHKEEAPHDKPTMTEEALNEDQQEARPPYKVEANEPITTEEVLDKGQQEDRSPFAEEGVRKKSDKFKPDEQKQHHESSLRTDQEISKAEEVRIRRVEESRRKARKLRWETKAAYMEHKVNAEWEDPTNKRVGPEEPEGLGKAHEFLQPPVDPVARRMDKQLQPDVLALAEERRRESSIRQERERGEDLKLDVLCQRLFQATFRNIVRSGQY